MDSFKFWAEFCFVQNYLNLFPTLFNVSLTCLFVCLHTVVVEGVQ